MIYGSVCSGIEAASVAWHPLGWRAAFLSEIEAFPRAVLKHHWPDTPLHGDFTTIQANEYEPIDLLVGGTPCQSFSIAGLRGGLDDERGNLALEYLRLADRLRPRWLVWENVPGVLSSNGGRDFGSILGGMVELGYGVAYRVLDAQFVRTHQHPRAVPQRRRRVFVVGYLGDWRRAAAVLFERHCLQGHPSPRRETGQSAPTLPSRSSAGGCLGTDSDLDGGLIAKCLSASHTASGRLDPSAETFIAHALRGEGFDASEDGTGRGTPLIPVHAFDARQSDVIQYGDHTGPLDTDGYTIPIAESGKRTGASSVSLKAGDGLGRPGDPMFTLGADSRHAIAYGIARDALDRSGEGAAGNAAERAGLGILEGLSPTIKAKGPGAVAFALRGRKGGAMPEIGGEQVGALRAASGGSSRDYIAFAENQRNEVRELGVAGALAGIRRGDAKNETLLATSAVRRLTPRECERLQGFSDDYTLIPWRKRMAADGPRYKALGNSMAVPVMAWIGQRIAMVEALQTASEAAA